MQSVAVRWRMTLSTQQATSYSSERLGQCPQDEINISDYKTVARVDCKGSRKKPVEHAAWYRSDC
ncbi:unnamed protein product [Gongylonema pulchrum]|uniref:Uncharacterized protein n=1 Tax=Gongylonema pulchrum TaxID=637853 RepID=A0A3P7NJ48_9BILA|nr:unnamed protein product [Gongylonema pulchrum]